MNAADRLYKDGFLSRGFTHGSRCYSEGYGNGTIERVGGNCCEVAFDSDQNEGIPHAYGTLRIILFENIEAPR